jgi:hypothetical protein
MKVKIQLLDPTNMLCSKKIYQGDIDEIMEKVKESLENLGLRWTMEIEVIEP